MITILTLREGTTMGCKTKQCTCSTQLPNQATFTPEEIAASLHTCDGGDVQVEQGVASGFGLRGLPVDDIQSAECLAKQVVFAEPAKNEYYIGLNKMGHLIDPTGATPDIRRHKWKACSARHFTIYCEVLRNGLNQGLKQLKDELRIH